MRTEKRPAGSHPAKHGYVLLAVLAVLVLVVTTLSTLSTISLRRALAASDAQIRLRQRLGAESIEAALLPRAASVFDRLEKAAEDVRKAGGTPMPIPTRMRSSASIGDVTFDVLLSDEDAKLNLNAVYHARGAQQVRSAIGRVAGPAVMRSLRLSPAVEPMSGALQTVTGDNDQEGTVEVPRAFRSWGEVFDLNALSRSVGDDAALPNLTTEVTCWGGGGVNIKRASDAAISQAAACVLPQAGADRLVDSYRDSPTTTLAILIQREASTENQRSQLKRLLGETSNHFSLWIDSSTKTRRSMRTFSVYRRNDEGEVINERFAF